MPLFFVLRHPGRRDKNIAAFRHFFGYVPIVPLLARFSLYFIFAGMLYWGQNPPGTTGRKGECQLYTIQEYRFAKSIEEAAGLLQKGRTNRVLAGGTWLRMGNEAIGTAIDLGRLGLDTVTENEETVTIGAAVTLRTLETSPVLQGLFGGVLPQCVAPIVGVQFRNLATVGAGVYSKYGFSDLLTALLALESQVELAQGGRLPLEEFLQSPPAPGDLLVNLHIRKDGRTAAFCTQRRTHTDFAVLSVCAARTPAGEYTVSVGARPAVARRSPAAAEAMKAGGAESAGRAAASELPFGTNQRGSAEYRKILCEVLTTRAFKELEGKA